MISDLPSELYERGSLKNRGPGERKAHFAVAVGFEGEAEAAGVGEAGGLVEADAEAAGGADRRAQQAWLDVRGHGAAGIAYAQHRVGTACERDAHRAAFGGALGERVADEVVGDVVEERARQARARGQVGGGEVDALAAIVAGEGVPPFAGVHVALGRRLRPLQL